MCPVCPHRNGEHCRHCHFVHDHMAELDGTRIDLGPRVVERPAPYAISRTVRRRVDEAAVGYVVAE